MYDNLPDAPGALLGYRKDGRPFYVIAGGAPDDGQDGGQEPSQGEPAQQEPQGEPPQPAGDSDGAAPQAEPPAQPAQSVDQLPDWAQKLIRDTRSDAAKNRTKAKDWEDKLAQMQSAQQDQMDKLAKALGLKKDSEPPDPETLLSQLANEQAKREGETARARQLSVELAVYRTAAGQGADGNRLLDSRTFLRSVEGLDPTLDDFEDLVKDKIAEAVEKYPTYRLSQEPAPPPPPSQQPAAPPSIPRANGQFTAPATGPRQLTMEDAKRMRPQEVVKAMEEGLFTSEGVGSKPRRW